MTDLVERLRGNLSMSMFATRADLYAEATRQREAAANEIERIKKAFSSFVREVDSVSGKVAARHIRAAYDALGET